MNSIFAAVLQYLCHSRKPRCWNLCVTLVSIKDTPYAE